MIRVDFVEAYLPITNGAVQVLTGDGEFYDSINEFRIGSSKAHLRWGVQFSVDGPDFLDPGDAKRAFGAYHQDDRIKVQAGNIWSSTDMYFSRTEIYTVNNRAGIYQPSFLWEATRFFKGANARLAFLGLGGSRINEQADAIRSIVACRRDLALDYIQVQNLDWVIEKAQDIVVN